MIMRKNVTKILFGITFLCIAVYLIGGAFDFWDLVPSFDGWWTIFIIVPSLGLIINNGIKFFNVLLLGTGVWLLLDAQNVFDNRKMDIFALALLLICLGIWLIFGNITSKNKKSDYKYNENSNNSDYYTGTEQYYVNTKGNTDAKFRPDYVSIFNDFHHTNNSEDFSGGTATSIFGDVYINLCNAKILKDVIFNATSIFGKVVIYVPENLQVEINGVSIFGDCKNYTNPDIKLYPKLTVKYCTIFGNVEIKPCKTQ